MSEYTKWKSAVNGQAKKDAQRIAKNIAFSLGSESKLNSVTSLEIVQWNPLEHCGIALVFNALDRIFPKEDFHAAAHKHLSIATSSQQIHHLSLYGGLCQIGLTASVISKGSTKYRGLLEQIDRTIEHTIGQYLGVVQQGNGEYPTAVYDHISGLSGVAVYLLSRTKGDMPQKALLQILETLVQLSRKNDQGLFGFTTQPEWRRGFLANNSQMENGMVDCGMAHGIVGALSVMSLALSKGVEVEGIRESVRTIADWLITHIMNDEWGIGWPAAVGIIDGQYSTVNNSIAEDGWCYGAPGIAMALLNAGRALGESEFSAYAIEALRSGNRRAQTQRILHRSPALCHGLAGMCQINLRFWHETNNEEFHKSAIQWFEELMNTHSESYVLGFREVDWRERPFDSPMFLSGASGIALNLLAVSSEVEPFWDSFLMMS
jgi:lantibiotic modifying enzyme